MFTSKSSFSLEQLQRDFFSYMKESNEKIENLNARLEHCEVLELEKLELRISQLVTRISEVEKFVTGSKDTNKKNTLENQLSEMFRKW